MVVFARRVHAAWEVWVHEVDACSEPRFRLHVLYLSLFGAGLEMLVQLALQDHVQWLKRTRNHAELSHCIFFSCAFELLVKVEATVQLRALVQRLEAQPWLLGQLEYALAVLGVQFGHEFLLADLVLHVLFSFNMD